LIDLDDPGSFDAIDSEGVLASVENLAEQCREAWDIGAAAEALPSPEGIDSVIVLGMGGSGVSGDVAQAVAEPRLLQPFRVIKGYGPLPDWVGRNTLAFAVSYSGSTEETVAALEDAHNKGARIVTISSGGPLAQKALEYGLAHVAIPSGLQPRASLGYLALPLLAVLEKMGLVSAMAPDVEETVAVLEALALRCDRSVPTAANPAKDLAHKLSGKVGVIYGGSPISQTAAMRFKCDINEYGKVPAFWNAFPELNHNEIVGWTGLTELTRGSFVHVHLRDSDEHPRVALRFEITHDLVGENVAGMTELHSEGVSALARLFSLVFVTQLASIYIGLAQEVDPGPVAVIQELKSRLADR